MQRPGTSSGARPGTASGSRVVAGVLANTAPSATDFIVRVRYAAGTVRCVLPSCEATIVDLRAAIALQCSIPLHRQQLSRTRRPWFASNDDGGGQEEFSRGEETLRQARVQHGDMLFVEQTPATPDESDPIADDNGRITRSSSELVRSESDTGSAHGDGSQILAFQGLDLTDESDQRATESQRAALQLIDTLRMETVSSTDSPSLNLQHLDELQRLIQQCTPQPDWSSRIHAMPTLNTAAASTNATFGDETNRSARNDSHRDELLDDDSRSNSRGASRQRLGSAGVSSRENSGDASSAAASTIAATDSTATAFAAELGAEVQYWRGRYERLRVKAEKMNAAGMSLKNRFDASELAHDQALLQLRARVRRRDDRMANLERTLAAWEQQDRARGGDGTVYVEPLPSALTSLAAAPALRSHQPSPPADSGDSLADNPSAPVRRARPESASRFRSRPPAGESSPPAGPVTEPTSRPSSQPSHGQRPSSSSGRSRLAAASLAAASGEGQPPPPFSSQADPEAEARAFKAARAASQLAAEREAAHYAITASKQALGGQAQAARAHMVAARNGPVAARPRSGAQQPNA